VQKPPDITSACGGQNVPGTDEIDGVEFRPIQLPHAGQPGQVINLANACCCVVHYTRVEHRTFDIFHPR
jgi:hypothetical protein